MKWSDWIITSTDAPNCSVLLVIAKYPSNRRYSSSLGVPCTIAIRVSVAGKLSGSGS